MSTTNSKYIPNRVKMDSNEKESLRVILKSLLEADGVVKGQMTLSQNTAVFRLLIYVKTKVPSMDKGSWMDLIQTVFYVITQDMSPSVPLYLRTGVLSAASNLSFDLVTKMRQLRITDIDLDMMMIMCFSFLKLLFQHGTESVKGTAKGLLRRLCSSDMKTPDTGRSMLHVMTRIMYATEPGDIFGALGVADAMTPYHVPCCGDLLWALSTGNADINDITTAGDDLLDTLVTSCQHLPQRVMEKLSPDQKRAIHDLARHLIYNGVSGKMTPREIDHFFVLFPEQQ